MPTVVYYGPDGSVRAIGAETEREGLEAIAADSHWSKAECYGAYPSISQLRTEAKECGGSNCIFVQRPVLLLPSQRTFHLSLWENLRWTY